MTSTEGSIKKEWCLYVPTLTSGPLSHELGECLVVLSSQPAFEGSEVDKAGLSFHAVLYKLLITFICVFVSAHVWTTCENQFYSTM